MGCGGASSFEEVWDRREASREQPRQRDDEKSLAHTDASGRFPGRSLKRVAPSARDRAGDQEREYRLPVSKREDDRKLGGKAKVLPERPTRLTTAARSIASLSRDFPPMFDVARRGISLSEAMADSHPDRFPSESKRNDESDYAVPPTTREMRVGEEGDEVTRASAAAASERTPSPCRAGLSRRWARRTSVLPTPGIPGVRSSRSRGRRVDSGCDPSIRARTASTPMRSATASIAPMTHV